MDVKLCMLNFGLPFVHLEIYGTVYNSLATGWTVRGQNPSGGRDFPTRPCRPWGPPSLIYVQ